MKRLFRQYPDAIARTVEIAHACQFSLDSLKYVYPAEMTTEDRTPQQNFVHLTWEGEKEHFEGVEQNKRDKLEAVMGGPGRQLWRR